MTVMPTQAQLIQDFEKLNIDVVPNEESTFIATLVIQPLIKDRFREAQENDPMLAELKEKVKRGEAPNFHITDDDILRHKIFQLCVPNDDELKRDILEEAHHMFMVQPSSTKMYQDEEKVLVEQHEEGCCKPAGLLQLLHVLEWKWDEVAMDFAVALPRAPSGQDTIWVVIDRLTKSAHFIPLKITDSMQKLAELYIKEIVKLHGIPAVIVSDQDP
ncbi:uncharacterized protein LOC133856767 [Alnus glutinosa]|uniref:uncharacterized protein LOC133856767 n=1 Tax=Alnus glutinosa TaxID=3517 RepID=UPI002D76E4ED|nr:uncharacterized protein LOC133856767 [Alnus glutinosa]